MKTALLPAVRYVHFRLHGAAPADERALRAELERHLLAYFGSEGYGTVNPRLMQYSLQGEAANPPLIHAVLSCRRGHELRLIAACALLSSMNGAPARLESMRISGTLHALREKSGLETPARAKR